jgi:hypothetical protein
MQYNPGNVGTGNAYRIFVGKRLRKHPLRGPKRRRKNDIRDVGCEDWGWVSVTQDHVQSRALLLEVWKLHVNPGAELLYYEDREI